MNKKFIWVDHNSLDFDEMPYRRGYKKVAGAFEFAVDRFGIAAGMLELDVKNIVKEPVYDLGNTTSDWRGRYFSVLDSVADNVYNTAGGNKTIYILYSGGLDSLCLLVAMKRSKHFKSFIEQGRLKISMTTSSINENPGYFFRAILPSIPICALNYETLMSDDDALLVTGDFGDYVVGSSDSLQVTTGKDQFSLMSPWTTFLNEHKNSPEEYVELVKQAKMHQPFDIVSVNQLTWWLSQCFCYQVDIVRPYIWSSTDKLDTMAGDSKVFRFFYDDLITAFSYEYMSTNPHVNSLEDARLLAKDYVAVHTKNDFIYKKPKVYSQRLTLRTVNKTSIYVEDGQFKFTTDGLNG